MYHHSLMILVIYMVTSFTEDLGEVFHVISNLHLNIKICQKILKLLLGLCLLNIEDISLGGPPSVIGVLASFSRAALCQNKSSFLPSYIPSSVFSS